MSPPPCNTSKDTKSTSIYYNRIVLEQTVATKQKARVENKKTEWLKKMEEMTDDRMVKKVYMENVPGKRPRGRPRKRWADDLKVN